MDEQGAVSEGQHPALRTGPLPEVTAGPPALYVSICVAQKTKQVCGTLLQTGICHRNTTAFCGLENVRLCCGAPAGYSVCH